MKIPARLKAEPTIPADIQQLMWTSKSKAVLWIGSFLGALFSFIGLCGAAHNGVAKESLGWLWWCLIFQLLVSTFGVLEHLRPGTMERIKLPRQIYMLASLLSFMTLMLAVDRSLQLAGFTVCLACI
jgi:hypothetical protein